MKSCLRFLLSGFLLLSLASLFQGGPQPVAPAPGKLPALAVPPPDPSGAIERTKRAAGAPEVPAAGPAGDPEPEQAAAASPAERARAERQRAIERRRDRNASQTGSVIVVDRPGGSGHVHLATDAEAFSELLASLSHTEEHDARSGAAFGSFLRLSDEGRVLWIPNGTRARILQRGQGSFLVHILEGAHKDAEGWVQARFTKAPGPTAKASPRPHA